MPCAFDCSVPAVLVDFSTISGTPMGVSAAAAVRPPRQRPAPPESGSCLRYRYSRGSFHSWLSTFAMLAENDVVWPEWLKPSANERAAAPPPRWSERSAPTRLPSVLTPKRLLQLADTLHDGQTRSRNSPEASSILATACDA